MEKMNGARMTIEQQVMTLEGANVSLEAMNAMKMGAASMKTIHKDMNIDQVDDIMDDIREQMDIANEINDAISQPLGGEVLDEDELLGELESLEQESLDEQLLGLGAAKEPLAKLPSAPQKAPAKKQAVDEDAELAALEASMA
jgi:charged multivesicular body protein 4